jgi:hypothetical protein
MLSFLRNNSLKIVYGIVIAFVVTTFMGAIFFNDAFKQSNRQEQLQSDRQNAIALVGTIPITNALFQLETQRILATLPKGTALNSQIIDAIKLNALSRAVESALLIHAANEQNVKVSRKEVNTTLLSVMDQFQVTSKKELKQAIAQQGGDYTTLLYQLKNDIRANKLKAGIIRSVALQEGDIKNAQYKYKIKELFVPLYSTQNVNIDSDVLYQQVSSLRQRILNSDDLTTEIANMNQRYGRSNSAGSVWVTMDRMMPDLARPLSSLNKNEISQPILTRNGYFILELSDKQALLPSENITDEALLSAWKNNMFYSYLGSIRGDKEIKLLEPNLRALKAKSEGDFEGAIAAYQSLVSNNPSNPYPHYLIAQVLLMKGDAQAAKQELLKAEIKESLLKGQVFVPEVHVLLAQLYDSDEFTKKRDVQYDKLIKNHNNNVQLLTYLQTVFKEKHDTVREAKVAVLLKQASATTNIIQDASALTKEEAPLELD